MNTDQGIDYEAMDDELDISIAMDPIVGTGGAAASGRDSDIPTPPELRVASASGDVDLSDEVTAIRGGDSASCVRDSDASGRDLNEAS